MKFVILLSLMCIGIGYAQQQSEGECYFTTLLIYLFYILSPI